jgi:Protein of unknown function (DUF3987)
MRIGGSLGFAQHGYSVYLDQPKTNGSGSAGRKKQDDRTDEAPKVKPSTRGNEKGHHSWHDPDWSILEERRGDLPEFPVDTLSTPWREWVTRAAHGAGVTPAHVAVPLLGIASSLIGNGRRVMASRSWAQPMTIWTGVVGFSGTGKTPGIDVTKRALSHIERDRRSSIAELQRAHEGRVETAKAARAQWKKDLKDAAQGKVVSIDDYRTKVASEPVMPAAAADPGPFVAPRLYVSNATIERLAALLQARPQGMLMLSDELAGLFLNMSRYSGGQDNEFWLEAWNGNPYTVERMERAPIVVSHLLIGVVGGLQPDKLARSFKGDLDGMYARFLFAWPADPPYRPLTNEVTEVEPEIVNALTRILTSNAGMGITLRPAMFPFLQKPSRLLSDPASSSTPSRTAWMAASGNGGPRVLRMCCGSQERFHIYPGRWRAALNRSELSCSSLKPLYGLFGITFGLTAEPHFARLDSMSATPTLAGSCGGLRRTESTRYLARRFAGKLLVRASMPIKRNICLMDW